MEEGRVVVQRLDFVYSFLLDDATRMSSICETEIERSRNFVYETQINFSTFHELNEKKGTETGWPML